MQSGSLDYARFTDGEWIEKLLTIPPIQSAHYYFFKIKCYSFLKYIAKNIFNTEDTDCILGEFYEFLSQNNWQILKSFRGENNASLSSYLSRCTVRHFISKKKQDNPITSKNSIEMVAITEELDYFIAEEEKNEPPVWKAFARLNERDRKLLRYLVIEGRSATDIADDIWEYVRSIEKDWRKLPVKRVQDTIAMMKKRALLSLLTELKKIS